MTRLLPLSVLVAVFIGLPCMRITAAESTQSPVDQLSKSLEAWGKLKLECGGNYIYTVRWSSWVGFGHETTIIVQENQVVQRKYREWDGQPKLVMPGEKPAVEQGATWTERGDQLGSHKQGAALKTLDELYAEAAKVVAKKLPAYERLYVRFDKQGLLQSCFTVDTRIADDAPRNGVAISSIELKQDSDKLKFDTYDGYFVSNRFEPKSPASFVTITDQKQLDNVLGVAWVMNDKSHRLAQDVFKTQLVLVAVKRGNSIWEYDAESVSAKDGKLTIRYKATAQEGGSATFSCPMILSVPKGEYTQVEFVENGKSVKKLDLKPKALKQ